MVGMPLNFIFSTDVFNLSESYFEIVDSLGYMHIPMCAILALANENGENRTVLLIGKFGTAVINHPPDIRIAGDLFTTNTLSEESACLATINLNAIATMNVIPLADGQACFCFK